MKSEIKTTLYKVVFLLYSYMVELVWICYIKLNKEKIMYGYVLKDNPCEKYRIHISENVIIFTVRDTLVDDILQKVTRKEVLDNFLAIDRTREGKAVYFSVKLPFITFPNYAHKGIDWKSLGECAEKISVLLFLFNMYFNGKKSNEIFHLSNSPQLMLIATSYSKTRDMHACPMELGFCEAIATLLKETYKVETSIDTAVHEAMMTYLKLSTKTKREFEKETKNKSVFYSGMFGVVSKVRDSGVPQFSVPGNCACLGENPDTFRYSRGMHSHNLDSTLQQMTMLVAVVTFWNEVLKPLQQEILSV
jgi:hypothetical protein